MEITKQLFHGPFTTLRQRQTGFFLAWVTTSLETYLLIGRHHFSTVRKGNSSQKHTENAAFTSTCKGLPAARLLRAGFPPHASWSRQNGSHGPGCSQQGGLGSWFALYFLSLVCSSCCISSEKQELQVEKYSIDFPSGSALLFSLKCANHSDYNLSLKKKLVLMDKDSKEQS